MPKKGENATNQYFAGPGTVPLPYLHVRKCPVMTGFFKNHDPPDARRLPYHPQDDSRGTKIPGLLALSLSKDGCSETAAAPSGLF